MAKGVSILDFTKFVFIYLFTKSYYLFCIYIYVYIYIYIVLDYEEERSAMQPTKKLECLGYDS